LKKNKILIDLLYSAILISILLIAYFIGNAIVTGLLLFVFSVVLGVNTALKLKNNMEGKFRAKFLYSLLLFLDIVLAVSSLFVVITAIIEA
jgi:hypothetical protein